MGCEAEGRKVWGAYAGHWVEAYIYILCFLRIMELLVLNAGLLVGIFEGYWRK